MDPLAPPDEPLRRSRNGRPLLFAALALELYLEPPAPSQVEAYEAALARVLALVGKELRWSHASTFGQPAPFDPADLDHVVEHVRGSAPPVLEEDPERTGARVHRLLRGSFSLVCHGAEIDWDASPFTFRFHAEPLGRPPRTDAATMLRVSVPATSDLAATRAAALAIATLLPVRWGILGLATLGWDVDHFVSVHEASFAVARRHPGFDLGLYALHMPTWHERLRTVSWITLLGPAMQDRLRRLSAPLPERLPAPLVRTDLGGGLVALEAPAPDPGDTNRGRFPAGYAVADRLVRPIRACRLHFSAPFDERTTEEWLRRFEVASS